MRAASTKPNLLKLSGFVEAVPSRGTRDGTGIFTLKKTMGCRAKPAHRPSIPVRFFRISAKLPSFFNFV